MSEERFIPAAGRRMFTPLFDPVMAVTTGERRWRGKVVDATLATSPSTILDIGSRNAAELVEVVGEVGARVYLGPSFKSYSYVFDEAGRIQWDADPGSGEAGLGRAVAFALDNDGPHNGRVRCMLYPAQLDTCSVALLTAARKAADENGLRISLHAAMNMIESLSSAVRSPCIATSEPSASPSGFSWVASRKRSPERIASSTSPRAVGPAPLSVIASSLGRSARPHGRRARTCRRRRTPASVCA